MQWILTEYDHKGSKQTAVMTSYPTQPLTARKRAARHSMTDFEEESVHQEEINILRASSLQEDIQIFVSLSPCSFGNNFSISIIFTNGLPSII